jgi:hypothetical protein
VEAPVVDVVAQIDDDGLRFLRRLGHEAAQLLDDRVVLCRQAGVADEEHDGVHRR